MRPQKKAGCGSVLVNLTVILFVVWLALHVGTGS